ncbi:hypothetical protein ZWY2020_004463 [Hordeum vulgare]|nr:hypothetical protein ZWY2020_004463 [Hordeum vulgare]
MLIAPPKPADLASSRCTCLRCAPAVAHLASADMSSMPRAGCNSLHAHAGCRPPCATTSPPIRACTSRQFTTVARAATHPPFQPHSDSPSPPRLTLSPHYSPTSVPHRKDDTPGWFHHTSPHLKSPPHPELPWHRPMPRFLKSALHPPHPPPPIWFAPAPRHLLKPALLLLYLPRPATPAAADVPHRLHVAPRARPVDSFAPRLFAFAVADASEPP